MLPMAQWVEAATTIKVRGYLWLFAGAFVQRAQLTSLTCSKGTWVYPLCYGLLFPVYRQWHCWSSLRLAFGFPELQHISVRLGACLDSQGSDDHLVTKASRRFLLPAYGDRGPTMSSDR